jgi:DNA-binding transcriptional MerR regulator
MRAAIHELEDFSLAQRTLSKWQAVGLVSASVRWDRRRGPSVLFNLSDLTRLRFVVRLRRAGLSPAKIRMVLDYLDIDLRKAFRPHSGAQIALIGGRAWVIMPGSTVPIDVGDPKQRVLFSIQELQERNEEVAKLVIAAA